jgi:diguanylate cyclase (GGDEF)-like protein
VTLDARDPARAVRSLAPFGIAALLAWLAIPIGSRIDWSDYAVASGLLVMSCVLAGLSAGRGLRPGLGQLPASLTFLAAVALLRDSAGGVYSGASTLALIPVFYTALYSAKRRHLYIVFAGLAAFYLVPVVAIGPPPYPHSQYRTALVMLSVSSIIGLTTQTLVARARTQVRDSRRRERMLVQVGQAVRGLFDSADPRAEVCQASRAISGATVSILIEPGDQGSLVATAMSGLSDVRIEIPAGCVHPVHTAFATGLPRVVAGDMEACEAHQQLWLACGRPKSVLYQPVLRGGDVTGVLVVAWPTAIVAGGTRATVVALLAHEAALAIHRADEISALAGMATTDPLTGLPNRRAWDERLSRAVAESQPVTIAMLDLDHFKHFNDAHGHPAGDRLLRETAAMWRDVLRSGDMVARLGGEEFGLLLFDTELDAAIAVTERVRELVTHGQTCSVGLAVRHPGEGVEPVMARVDRALYDAKSAGRDRACLSI